MKKAMNRILITIVLAVLLLSVTACHNGKLTSSSNNEPDSLSIAAENQVEMPALARLEPDPNIQSDWKGIFLSFIGACQKKLNQPEEAKKNFEQAYQYYRKYMSEERFKLLDFQTCIVD